MKKHPYTKSLLAIVLLVLPTIILNGAKLEESQQHQFAADTITEVILSNINGKIVCHGEETDTIKLLCEITVRSGDRETAESFLERIEVDMVENAGKLEISTQIPKNQGGFWSWITRRHVDARVDYTLQVPSSTKVTLNTVNGGVYVDRLSSDLKVTSVNGGLKADHVSGRTQMETVNGGVSCLYDSDQIQDSIKLNSVNGGITLSLPGSASFTLSVQTVNGGIGCEFELPEDAVKKKRMLNAAINGGGNPVNVSTVNGGVGIQMR
jgi:hypothetical protein